MASITTTIKLTDKMTSPLLSITNAMSNTIAACEEIQNSMDDSFDTSKIEAARSSIESANIAIDNLGRDIEENANKQNKFNQQVQEGSRNLDAMAGKVKGVVTAFLGFAAVKGAINWMKDSFDLANIQTNAETQLKVVLSDMGAASDAYDKIKQKASQIQGMTVFGDEAMLGGAAELSTYIKDADAVMSMMDTLSNYASGMSGGGEVDSKQMVEYATQLGKVLIGEYDGIKKKGFELTEAQEKIIENGSDMEKALVVDEVINESWANLANTMAQTPQGKIIQFQNTMGDLREEVGNKLYPAVINLVDKVQQNLPQIQSLLNGVCSVLTFAINIVTGLAIAAGYVAQFIGENWGIIEPIIWGIVTALLAYELVSGIVTGVIAAQTMAESVHAAATAMATGATFAQTAAQYGLNAALLACPITWILLIIIAIIAAIYAIIGAINKVTGSSLSATGLIFGAITTAVALIWNLFLALLDLVLGIINIFVNKWIMFANFFANIFNDPIGAIVHLFGDFADSILGVIETIAKALDKVFGSNLAGTVKGWRNGLSGMVEKVANQYGNGSYEKVAEELDLSSESLGLKRWEYGDAFNTGYQAGSNLEDSIGNMFSIDSLNLDGLGLTDQLDSLQNGVNDIATDTGNISDALDITDEDLKYLRDLAEQEVINRFTTAEIHVDMGGITNNVTNNTDLDGVVNYLVEGIEIAMEETARGV